MEHMPEIPAPGEAEAEESQVQGQPEQLEPFI